jgi:nucleoside 2-deoxyribosyltransferase
MEIVNTAHKFCVIKFCCHQREQHLSRVIQTFFNMRDQVWGGTVYEIGVMAKRRKKLFLSHKVM